MPRVWKQTSSLSWQNHSSPNLLSDYVSLQPFLRNSFSTLLSPNSVTFRVLKLRVLLHSESSRNDMFFTWKAVSLKSMLIPRTCNAITMHFRWLGVTNLNLKFQSPVLLRMSNWKSVYALVTQSAKTLYTISWWTFFWWSSMESQLEHLLK